MVDNRLENSHNNYTYTKKPNNEFELKSAAGEKSLNSSSIEQNTTIIRRGFESVNFTVNVSGFIDANQTFMQIKFTNNTVINSYNMSLVSGTSDIFTYTYSPSGLAPTGLQIVSFRVLNESLIRINTQTTLRNFTILPNAFWLPNGTANEYKRGEFLYADFIINNSDNFDWTLTVVDAIQSPQTPLFILGENLYNFIFEINESFDQINKFYYIQVEMDETSSGKSTTEYLQFKVLQPESLIISSTVKFNPDSVFRKELCRVQVNVSAITNDLNPVFVNVTLVLKDSNNVIVFNRLLSNDDFDENFESTFSVSVNSPAGKYDYTFTASYRDVIFDEYSGVLTVKNNRPDIDSYEINGIDTDERISVLYGEDLVFEFDVFDEEGIQYITIKLIDQDNEDYEISREYESDLEITIRTEDLITGTWTVYVSVTDIDGETTNLDSDYNTGPQEIEIIPDLLSDSLPWIMLFIGLTIGLIGIIIIALSKRRSKDLVKTITKEKGVTKEKLTKPKREKKTKPVKKEIDKKKIEPQETEEKEPDKIMPKRKIKRKLK